MKKIFNELKEQVKDQANRKLVITLSLSGLLLGVILTNVFSTPVSEQKIKNAAHDHAHKVKNQRYTCSMHPQINKGKPGKCPICGMTLIPIDTDDGGEADDIKKYTVKLSKYALKIAEVQTAIVERKILSERVKLVGKIDYDETRFANITAWFPGRVEKMYVDYTGIKVNKGDHLVKIYSPELLSAQEELLSAKRAIRGTSKSNYAGIRKLTRETLTDVRNKLKLWGMTDEQIKNIERRKKTSRTMIIYSPVNGVVIKKSINDGMYVKTGSNIYSIADLDHLWVKLDAYELDISKLRFGQKVIFYAESYPGKKFVGKISFIDPILDMKTQSIKIRVNVENKEGLLRPGMFVHATVMAKISKHGVVIDREMSDKYTCRMHPEILKEKGGVCPICGMDLVEVSSLGYHSHDKGDTSDAPLVIPATAPLLTGERAVVYIALGEGKFEGREIILGTKVGDYYVVESGLNEGEEVVTNGNFKIDSSAQILAKKSMMNPSGGGPAMSGHAGHNMGGKKSKAGVDHSKMKMDEAKIIIPEAFIKSLDDAYEQYLNIQKDLTNDKADSVATSSENLLKALDHIDMSKLEGDTHIQWMELSSKMNKNISDFSKSKDLGGARKVFEQLSRNFVELKETFGFSKKLKLKKFYCPMVKAPWLQLEDNTLNPYYGQSMLTCGEKK